MAGACPLQPGHGGPVLYTCGRAWACTPKRPSPGVRWPRALQPASSAPALHRLSLHSRLRAVGPPCTSSLGHCHQLPDRVVRQPGDRVWSRVSLGRLPCRLLQFPSPPPPRVLSVALHPPDVPGALGGCVCRPSTWALLAHRPQQGHAEASLAWRVWGRIRGPLWGEPGDRTCL